MKTVFRVRYSMGHPADYGSCSLSCFINNTLNINIYTTLCCTEKVIAGRCNDLLIVPGNYVLYVAKMRAIMKKNSFLYRFRVIGNTITPGTDIKDIEI